MDKRRPDLTVRIFVPSKDGTPYSTIELFKGSQFSDQTLGDQAGNPNLSKRFRVRIDRVWFPQARPVALYDAARFLNSVITNGVLPDILQD